MRHAPAALLALAGLLAAACATTAPLCPTVAAAVQKGVSSPDRPPDCPPPREYPFRNVVLEGGGVKGIAYAGAFSVLDRQGILPAIERVAGTSAGAIQATLLALRYSPAEIESLLFHLDFKQFEDGGASGLFRFFRRFGWFRGDYYLGLMRCVVGAKTGNPRATFADLERLGMRDLRVFSADLDTGAAKEFSRAATPDFEVALAARMSGSFPLFFASVRSEGDVFVDGGLLRNYPVDAFDGEQGPNHETLGFVLENTHAPPRHRPVNDLVQYAEALLETLLNVQVQALSTNPPDLERTVLVNDLGISTLNFELTEQQKHGLIAQGAQCTCNYLRDWQRWQQMRVRPGQRDLAPGESIPITNRGKCGSAFD